MGVPASAGTSAIGGGWYQHFMRCHARFFLNHRMLDHATRRSP
ncbi:hypothetical protein D8I24_4534 [Cupriavidus necator H850]|nr:hypothetical protein D8I24_4534 [Cupriavidus necator H850]